MNSEAQQLTGEYRAVAEVIRQRADKFATLGFKSKGVTVEGSERLQTFAVFHFLNQRTGIALDISFFVTRRNRVRGFNVLIIRADNHKLSVNEYLRLHGRGDLLDVFTYRESTDLPVFADTFLQTLFRLLNNDLKPVIEGTVWEETPIDWMGYK